jgi:hypothetical protein
MVGAGMVRFSSVAVCDPRRWGSKEIAADLKRVLLRADDEIG